ncbi:TetR/AcrR family transcriptional regulator [Sinimarinibacterium thermocellulolyticum]|uniref:TetR/AcrR family transcriptional regulator n=1 Tax=Sinimarinibacterium thermocellulolyticum TaxID=3170016 RepID=A0ABV2A9R9_9GAMM
MNARESMIALAGTLAAEIDFWTLSVDHICARAGVDRAEFAASFGDLDGYLVAVQEAFMDRLRDRLIAVTSGVPSGVRRVQLATESFLDTCLKQRPLRAWLLQARGRPPVYASLRRRLRIYWVLVGAELRAMGWRDGVAGARLYMAMVDAATSIEHRTGRQEKVRAALWHFIEHGG